MTWLLQKQISVILYGPPVNCRTCSMSCPVCYIQESLLGLHSDYECCSKNTNSHVDQIINVAYHQATFEVLSFCLSSFNLYLFLVHNNYIVYDVENNYSTNQICQKQHTFRLTLLYNW